MSSHHRALALSAIASVIAIVMVLVLGSSTKKTPAPQTAPMNVPAHGQNVLSSPPTTVNTGAAKTQHTPAELPVRDVSREKTQTPAPREQTRTTQPEVKQPENKMTPEETPLESPATPAVVGTGYVTISARPFASIAIDSEERGTTPKQRLPVSAGAHTIVLSCTVCTPPTQETRQITVQAGAEEKVIVYFKE
ncbi:hypothetical protein HYV72_00295 [Candidatus Uhrbacteria bacterium]|nr:hypothetical protein [Candidatus Uhrbacteria bacterium]